MCTHTHTHILHTPLWSNVRVHFIFKPDYVLPVRIIRKFRLQGVVTQIEPYGEIYQTIGQCILSNCNPAANKQYVNKARGEQTCLYKLCQAVS